MTISQWLCENQVLASIIMTIISIGLVFSIIGLFIWFKTEQEMKDYDWKKEQAKREELEANPELKAKKERSDNIKTISVLGTMVTLSIYTTYTTGIANSWPIISLTCFITLINLGSVIKNRNVKDIIGWFVFVSVIILFIGCIGYIIKQLYDWWILHICHFN